MKKSGIVPAVIAAGVILLAGGCVKDTGPDKEDDKGGGKAAGAVQTRNIEAEEVFKEVEEPEDDEELIYFSPEEYEQLEE